VVLSRAQIEDIANAAPAVVEQVLHQLLVRF
jgi:hypothetical protein